MNNVWWALAESLAFTLSRKERSVGIRQMFKKYGNPLKDPDSKVFYWRPDTFARDSMRLARSAKSNSSSFASMLRSIETS